MKVELDLDEEQLIILWMGLGMAVGRSMMDGNPQLARKVYELSGVIMDQIYAQEEKKGERHET